MDTKKNILIVDDNQDILDALSLVLSLEGYNVRCVSTQEDVDEIAQDKNAHPDLIMLDVLLSGYDGRTIARKLKSSDMTKHIPIIMMSAHPNVEKSIKESGANDFIPKPFEMDDMLSKIKLHLQLV